MMLLLFDAIYLFGGIAVAKKRSYLEWTSHPS